MSAEATAGGLRQMFAPAAVAVVGASATEGKAGYAMLASLATFGGPVFPINPRAHLLAGRRAFPSVQAVGEPVDLAVLCIPPASVPGAVRDCAAAGVGAAIVCSGGMAESGPEGQALQDEALSAARAGGVRLLGPNTSGFLAPARDLCASFVTEAAGLPAGGLAIIAQSGGVNLHLAFAAAERGLGLSLAVGLGNAADVEAADVLCALADDRDTSVIVLHLEGVPHGRRLFEAVRAATAVKPVVVLKAGQGDVDEFAQSHTGAMTGSYAIARAALTQAGAVVVDDTTALLDAAEALATRRLPPNPRPGVGLVSGQAGPAILLADALGAQDVALPAVSAATRRRLTALLPPITYQRNPVDTGRPDASFGDVVSAVGADPAIDLLLVYALYEPQALDAAAVLGPVAAGQDAPLVFATQGPEADVRRTRAALRTVGLACFTSIDGASRAVQALVADARGAHARARSSEAPPLAMALPDGPIDEDGAKALLQAVGLRTPRRRLCANREQAARAAEELSAPLVVKVSDAAITHKSDQGGVHLGVSTPAELAAALDAIDAIPGDGSRAYLLEEQAPPGAELILGGLRDPAFGPVVSLGLGGVTAEVFADVVLRLAPVGHEEALDMVSALRGSALLDGFRGLPAVDRDELAAGVVAVSRLIASAPQIRELDINPVRATAAGLIALDALVVRD